MNLMGLNQNPEMMCNDNQKRCYCMRFFTSKYKKKHVLGRGFAPYPAGGAYNTVIPTC